MKAKELKIVITGNNAEAIISTIYNEIRNFVPAIKDNIKQFVWNDCSYYEK